MKNKRNRLNWIKLKWHVKRKHTDKHIKKIEDTKQLMLNRLRSAESAHDRFQNLVTSKHRRKARKIPSRNSPKMSGMKDVMSGHFKKKQRQGTKKKQPLFSFMTTRLGWLRDLSSTRLSVDGLWSQSR